MYDPAVKASEEKKWDLIKKILMKDIDVLLDCIDEAILIVDYQGNILKQNEAFSRLTDLSGRSSSAKT